MGSENYVEYVHWVISIAEYKSVENGKIINYTAGNWKRDIWTAPGRYPDENLYKMTNKEIIEYWRMNPFFEFYEKVGFEIFKYVREWSQSKHEWKKLRKRMKAKEWHEQWEKKYVKFQQEYSDRYSQKRYFAFLKIILGIYDDVKDTNVLERIESWRFVRLIRQTKSYSLVRDKTDFLIEKRGKDEISQEEYQNKLEELLELTVTYDYNDSLDCIIRRYEFTFFEDEFCTSSVGIEYGYESDEEFYLINRRNGKIERSAKYLKMEKKILEYEI